MSAPDPMLNQFQSGDPLVVEALRQPMYAQIEAHLSDLAGRARTVIADELRCEISRQAFEAACAMHSHYLPQYASLEAWFLKHAESIALQSAAQRSEYAPLVLTILFSYAGLLDRDIQRRFPMIDGEDRSDLVFQSLLASYDRVQSFDPQRGLLESWLRAMAAFQALTFLRKHHHRQVRGPDADLQIAQVAAPTLLTDLAAQAEGEIQPELQPHAADLEQLLAMLPARTADAIRRYMRGESYEQIAERMGLSYGYTRVLVHRGRQALQEQGAA
ncbi:MAG: RNA polymerase sigma factor, partial [Oscillochloris sp.]|nr:RNA polymerase sigma factor [Oscillochloris sp.]